MHCLIFEVGGTKVLFVKVSVVERLRFVPPEKNQRTSKLPTQENGLWTTISVITQTLRCVHANEKM